MRGFGRTEKIGECLNYVVDSISFFVHICSTRFFWNFRWRAIRESLFQMQCCHPSFNVIIYKCVTVYMFITTESIHFMQPKKDEAALCAVQELTLKKLSWWVAYSSVVLFWYNHFPCSWVQDLSKSRDWSEFGLPTRGQEFTLLRSYSFALKIAWNFPLNLHAHTLGLTFTSGLTYPTIHIVLDWFVSVAQVAQWKLMVPWFEAWFDCIHVQKNNLLSTSSFSSSPSSFCVCYLFFNFI